MISLANEFKKYNKLYGIYIRNNILICANIFLKNYKIRNETKINSDLFHIKLYTCLLSLS